MVVLNKYWCTYAICFKPYQEKNLKYCVFLGTDKCLLTSSFYRNNTMDSFSWRPKLPHEKYIYSNLLYSFLLFNCSHHKYNPYVNNCLLANWYFSPLYWWDCSTMCTILWPLTLSLNLLGNVISIIILFCINPNVL